MPSNVHHSFGTYVKEGLKIYCSLGISERQGEAAGSARAEAHGPGPRDKAGRADRLHHLHPPPHVRSLGKGDCAVYGVREQNKIENPYPPSDNLKIFKLDCQSLQEN